jgi:hypothetical protein
MHRTVWMVVVLCLLAVKAPARADESAEAKALLDKALKALGDRERLARLPAVTLKTKGAVHINGMTAEFSGEWSAHAQEKYRLEMEIAFDGLTRNAVLVLNKAKGWIREGGAETQDLTKEEDGLSLLHLLQIEFNAVRLTEWLVALEEKGYQLSPLGELKVNDRAAVGIKIAQKGRPDIDLFFDKETMLPLRSELRVKEGKDGQEVLHAFYYSDYKDVDGVKHFTKLMFRRDDKVLVEMELSEIKLQEKLDDGVFDKP